MKYKRYTLDTPYPVGPVHLYVFEIEDYLVMFDAGPFTAGALTFVKEKIDFKKLRYVFITHSHADHYGLENFLARNSNATILLPLMDHQKFTNLDKRISVSSKLLTNYGFNKELIEGMGIMMHGFVHNIPMPINYKILEESTWDTPVKYLLCPGHSKSDAVYLIGNYAITGDVLLNNIYQTPLFDIDYDKMDRFNNYEAYCDTIKKMSILKNYTILPGHREHTSIEDIVTFYVTKTIERASKIKERKELPVYQILKAILPKALKDPFTAYIKTSEILFFLDFLNNPNLLISSLKEAGLFNKKIEQAMKIIL